MTFISICKKDKGFFWIRLGMRGCGLHFKNTKMHGKTFSERNNFGGFIKVGNWTIKYLKPYKKP